MIAKAAIPHANGVQKIDGIRGPVERCITL
jgi:hypothetical protein